MKKIRMLPQPGPLLVAADLHLLAGDRDPGQFAALFGPLQLAVSEANSGRARSPAISRPTRSASCAS